METYAKNNPDVTWLTRDVDDEMATSKLNREFTLNYYQNVFLTQRKWNVIPYYNYSALTWYEVHRLYVLPKRDQNSALIFAVMDLKQGDKKCLAFHSKVSSINCGYVDAIHSYVGWF